jgi:hypothetical protein
VRWSMNSRSDVLRGPVSFHHYLRSNQLVAELLLDRGVAIKDQEHEDGPSGLDIVASGGHL